MDTRSIILVLESDTATSEFIAEALSDEGFVVHSVKTALEGITTLSDSEPDLILVEYDLPAATGLTFARAVREIGVKTPIVLMTTNSRPPMHPDIECITNCLFKPFDLDLLLSCVQTYIRALP
jgi:DNA-binding response OmpR family regulator